MKFLSSSNIPQEFCFNKTAVALPEVEEVVLHTEKVIYILKKYDAIYDDVHRAQERVSCSHLSLSYFMRNTFVCSDRENNNKIGPTLFSHMRKILKNNLNEKYIQL